MAGIVLGIGAFFDLGGRRILGRVVVVGRRKGFAFRVGGLG